jgi:hypothetical protein
VLDNADERAADNEHWHASWSQMRPFLVERLARRIAAD